MLPSKDCGVLQPSKLVRTLTAAIDKKVLAFISIPSAAQTAGMEELGQPQLFKRA